MWTLMWIIFIIISWGSMLHSAFFEDLNNTSPAPPRQDHPEEHLPIWKRKY